MEAMWRRILQPGLIAVAIASGGLAACSSGRQSVSVGAPRAASSTPASPTSTSVSMAAPTHPLTAPTVAAIITKIPYAGTTVRFTMSPISGPIGTRVHVSGQGFTGAAGDEARAHSYFFALVGLPNGPGCELIAPSVDPQVSIDLAGNLTGSFSIPSRGSCFQQSGSARPLPPGSYYITLGSHSDSLAQFAVTR